MDKRYLSPEELAKMLGVSVLTIYNWTSQRKIPFVKIGRLVRFELEETSRWIDEKKVPPEDYS